MALSYRQLEAMWEFSRALARVEILGGGRRIDAIIEAKARANDLNSIEEVAEETPAPRKWCGKCGAAMSVNEQTGCCTRCDCKLREADRRPDDGGRRPGRGPFREGDDPVRWLCAIWPWHDWRYWFEMPDRELRSCRRCRVRQLRNWAGEYRTSESWWEHDGWVSLGKETTE